jgi:hypothetical protein
VFEDDIRCAEGRAASKMGPPASSGHSHFPDGPRVGEMTGPCGGGKCEWAENGVRGPQVVPLFFFPFSFLFFLSKFKTSTLKILFVANLSLD